MESRCNELRKEERETDQTVHSLCEDLLIDILFRHDAAFLHNVLSLVCRPWLDIIREPWFARAHLRRSHPQILRPLSFPILTDLTVVDACDGLLLVSPKDSNYEHKEILNPITGARERLPDNKIGCGWGDATPMSWTLATCSSSKYKVIHTSNTVHNEFHIEIIDLDDICRCHGNAWRDISEQCAGLEDVRWIKTDGFLHAVSGQGHPYLHCHMYRGTLDLEKETFGKMRLPPCCKKGQFQLLDSRDRWLLLADYQSLTEFDVWMARDDDGGNWVKLYSFVNVDWFKGLMMPLVAGEEVCVNSIMAVSGSEEEKRVVLLVEVKMRGGWKRYFVWVLCEEEEESSLVELGGEESYWVEFDLRLGYRPVHEYVESLISWHM